MYFLLNDVHISVGDFIDLESNFYNNVYLICSIIIFLLIIIIFLYFRKK